MTKKSPNITDIKTKKLSYAWKAIWVGVPGIIGAVWLLANRDLTKEIVKLTTRGDTEAQVSYLIANPLAFPEAFIRSYFENADLYFMTMTGAIGDRTIGLDVILACIFSAVLLVFGVILSKGFNSSEKQAASLSWHVGVPVIIIGMVGAISLSMYLVFSGVGDFIISGIQGRYFMPLLPFAIVSLSIFLGSKQTSKPRAFGIVYASAILFLTLTSYTYYIVNY